MTGEETIVEAWHFLRANRCMGYDDGREVRPGEWLACTGEPALCVNGMHASVRASDALQYAPGPVVCRVQLRGGILRGDDKLVARERRVIWMADATETLRAFARKCALDVIHLWDAPEVVRQYLETGDESLRDAARDAARDAGDAARDAAYAAWATTWATTRDAAWGAARDAARDAATAAAARDAAWATTWDDARVVAWCAARDRQNARLEQMLNAIDNKEGGT